MGQEASGKGKSQFKSQEAHIMAQRAAAARKKRNSGKGGYTHQGPTVLEAWRQERRAADRKAREIEQAEREAKEERSARASAHRTLQFWLSEVRHKGFVKIQRFDTRHFAYALENLKSYLANHSELELLEPPVGDLYLGKAKKAAA